ncbi:MAG: sigma-E processing peptidase SpoIIGA [Oscillospiraceae bacterium]|nr:sigma-E processing peptidase SpoIIGA [Oscillospiraceae bacterium]
MNTIYIDLLVVINLYITYFLLKASCVFLHRKVSSGRILSGALTGGASSLMILLPTLPFLLNIAAKIIVGGLIVTVVFFPLSKSGSIAEKVSGLAVPALVFVVVNVVFAGLTLMLWFFAAPFGMSYNNGYAYFDISFTVLVVTTAAAYGIIRILRYVLDVKNAGQRSYKVKISRYDSDRRVKNTVTLDALADSGNLLVDYFSGLPVVICPYSSIKKVAPAGVLEKEPPVGIRLLPYNTVNSAGLIPVFKADEIVITDASSDNSCGKSVSALIGVAEDLSQLTAIFNPKLLI